MTLLNPPDILPEAMRFLLRAVLSCQGSRCEKQALLALVAPVGLAEAMRAIDRDGDEGPSRQSTAASGNLIAKNSLTALSTLGFVDLNGSDVAASDLTLRQWGTAQQVNAAAFSRMVRRQTWAVAACGNGQADRRVADLINALAVLFAVPEPLRPFEFETGAGRRFASAQTRWFGQSKRDWPVTNSTQFLPFLRWAPYLGLAEPITSGSLIADASRALLEDLTLLPQRLRVTDFLDQCSEALPISDGGAWSLWGPDDGGGLSPGMSLTMRSLEAAGHLTLPIAESDTETVVVTLGVPGDAIRVSHLNWHPKTPAEERS